jgi:CDP-diacylglycerol--glycerol-3-phosphate 3-phosphatidyltransferase
VNWPGVFPVGLIRVKGGHEVISERAREATRDLLNEVSGLIARLGLTPSMLTWIGFGLNLMTAWFLVRGEFLIGGVLVLASNLFDALDGSLARTTGRVSSFGAFLDSTLDRFSEAALYLGLLLFFARQPSEPVALGLVYLAIVGSLMVSYTRARAEALGFDGKVGIFTRFERVLVLAVGLLVGQVVVALGALALVSFLTAFHRMWHVWRQAAGR